MPKLWMFDFDNTLAPLEPAVDWAGSRRELQAWLAAQGVARGCSRSSRAATWCCTRRCARAFARAAMPPAPCWRGQVAESWPLPAATAATAMQRQP